jgi:hypothetical protein
MARTQTLQEMVASLRAEAGHSLAVAQGVNAETTLKYLLKRTQEEMWTAFIWPELTAREDVPLTPGIYTYEFTPNMSFDAIREAWSAQTASTSWAPVNYGIGEDKISVGGANSSDGDPVACWEASGRDIGGSNYKFRVWPTPQSGGWLRFKGNRELEPLINSTDRSTLDATCIILFAASELLARAKAEDAANKMQKAQRHLTKLLGNQVTAKNKVSTLGSMSPGNGAYSSFHPR